MAKEKILKSHTRVIEKNALKLNNGYRRWYNLLYLKVLRMFEWTGLPFPQREIEVRLIESGLTGMVRDENRGIMVAWGSAYGVTEYTDVFLKYTYSAPTAKGGTVKVGKECCLCYANSAMYPIIGVVEKYASLLAHSDITLKCALVNTRHSEIITATDQQTREDIRTWYSEYYEGEPYSILEKSLMGDSNIQNIINPSAKVDLIAIINCQNEILRSFYREIGIRWTRQKQGNMTEDELTNDDRMLLFNVSDMLKCRQEFCEEVKKIFGLDISVKLSDEYKITADGESEGSYDGDN